MKAEAPAWVAVPIVGALLWLALGWRIVAAVAAGMIGMVILGVVMRDG